MTYTISSEIIGQLKTLFTDVRFILIFEFIQTIFIVCIYWNISSKKRGENRDEKSK